MTTALKPGLCSRTIDTPLGPMFAQAGDKGLVKLEFVDEAQPDEPRAPARGPEPEHLAQTAEQLAEYFAGARRQFTVPLDLRGTAFQRRVWRSLMTIPFGQTRSYCDLAHALGDANAARAVGQANGRNPVAVIVPCHRVIAADGTLGGYGGGIERKRWLLGHEGALPALIGSPPGLFEDQDSASWICTSETTS